MPNTYHVEGGGRIVASGPEWTPHIAWTNPMPEPEAAAHLSHQLQTLKGQENHFRSAIELIYHVRLLVSNIDAAGPIEHNFEEKIRILPWVNIAGTHAAISLSQFRDALFSVRTATGRCPSLKSKIDTKTLEQMPERFMEAFPSYKVSRDGAVHYVDKIYTPKKIEENRSLDGSFYHGTMIGDALVFTVGGEQVGLDVSIETLEKIAVLRRQTFECFRKVSV